VPSTSPVVSTTEREKRPRGGRGRDGRGGGTKKRAGRQVREQEAGGGRLTMSRCLGKPCYSEKCWGTMRVLWHFLLCPG
jgi:hypothetical protein